MRPARKPVTLLRVFLEPVRAAFWVQPYQRVPVRVWLLFAVRRAPALMASLATHFFRVADQFIVSIAKMLVLQGVAADDGLVSVRQRIVGIVSTHRPIVSIVSSEAVGFAGPRWLC